MISAAEARSLVLQHQKDFGQEEVPLLQAAGRILALPVAADRDFPPYHRVMMDGIAISATAFTQGIRSFPVEGIQAAGQPLQRLRDAACCIEVMTGAVLPEGTDTIIPYEECTVDNGVACIQARTVVAGRHIHRQGADAGAGTVLLDAGIWITPAHIAVLASVGCSTVPVRRLPEVAVCSTGDELVPVGEQPAPHQVRRSNAAFLAAALQREGITAGSFHWPDDKEAMLAGLGAVLNAYDVVLFSGAVSRGKFDYLPEVLATLGMQQVFHRVAQKPGKPLLFGTVGKTLVFGLPGNPVSSLVCYEVYFREWLYASLGLVQQPCTARLTEHITFRPALTNYALVRLGFNEGMLSATPVHGTNSGDIPSLVQAGGLLVLPAMQEVFKAGDALELIPLSSFL